MRPNKLAPRNTSKVKKIVLQIMLLTTNWVRVDFQHALGGSATDNQAKITHNADWR